MKVLFAASEAAPFIKTGGLGDVVGSLPKALKKMGVDVRVILPKYEEISGEYTLRMEYIGHFYTTVGWRNQYAGVFRIIEEEIPYYFVDNEYYYKRKGIYGHFDEAERFVFFARSVLDSLPYVDFQPDIIHCHDWQSALLPVFLNDQYKINPFYSGIKTILTIHNLKYQGRYGKDILEDVVGLDQGYGENHAIEYYDDINFMKAGLYYSDVITTVSPTYASEIQLPYYGEGLDGVLRGNQYKLKGILNGIDYDIFNPKIDEHLYVNYHRSMKKKSENKVKLQERLGLIQDETIPMIGMVTRLVEQKGIDLLTCVLPDIINMNVQFVLLGTGENRYEQMLWEAEKASLGKMRVLLQFDVDLAQKIYGGSDIFLMPSLFEPCGLSQMISLRYGTIPIVRETGGLKDTVLPYNEYENTGTGFSFANYNAHEMLYTLQRAIKVYSDEKNRWNDIIKRGMKEDFSWERSAKEYIHTYEDIVQMR